MRAPGPYAAPVRRVLVLCHANRFRSPLVHALLEQACQLGDVTVRSAGFKPGGHVAAKPIREVARSWGLDLTWHRSKQVDRGQVAAAQLVVYMDGGNLKRLTDLAAAPHVAQRWACLGEWARPAAPRIPDPAFLRGPAFDEVMELIRSATLNLAAELWPQEEGA